MTFIVILFLVLAVGLFIGSRFEGAREAHQHFTAYRARAIGGLGGWLKNAVFTAGGVAVLVIGLYIILNHFHLG